MKKITLLMFAFAATFAYNANAQSNATNTEIVLTQNTDEVFDGAGVACSGSDNWWFREYVLADEGVTTDVMVTGVEFAVSQMAANEEFEVYAFEYAGFPSGFDILSPPAAIASGILEVTPGEVGIKVRAEFDVPAVVSAGSTVVVAVVQPFADGNVLFLGATSGETKESFLASEGCEITEPATVAEIGFPEAYHLVNLVVDDALSVGDVLAENVSIYPNPTTDVFNVQLPSNVVVNSSSVVDILGKTTGATYSNGVVDVNSLETGVYFLNLDTNFGTYTQKVVKQ